MIFRQNHLVYKTVFCPCQDDDSFRGIRTSPRAGIAGLLCEGSISIDRHLAADEPGPLAHESIAGSETGRNWSKQNQPLLKEKPMPKVLL